MHCSALFYAKIQILAVSNNIDVTNKTIKTNSSFIIPYIYIGFQAHISKNIKRQYSP